MKKDLPIITWQNLAPPYHEYEYFEECEQYPFRQASGEFDDVNAWWLSEAAMLVYAQEEFVASRFQRAGLPRIRYFDGESTDCFVASNDAYIFVVFRGTESRLRPGSQDFENIIADVRADVNILLVDALHGGKVHQGFNDALDEIWEELASYLKTIHTFPRRLWMTGHSLGAALATLAADRYHDVQGLYTFGSPRVGDGQFKEQFSVNTYRVAHNNDIVCALPPPGIYQHVGELWYIDSSGGIHHDADPMERFVDAFRGELRNITDAFERTKQGEFSFIPGGIKDHVPLFYAIHLWNNIPPNT